MGVKYSNSLELFDLKKFIDRKFVLKFNCVFSEW